MFGPTGLRHAIKNYASTKTHIKKAKAAMQKSMEKAAKRHMPGVKGGRKKKSKFAVADDDPELLKHIQSFPPHLNIAVVKSGNIQDVVVAPYQPFIYRLPNGCNL